MADKITNTTPIKQLYDKNTDGTKIAFNPQTSSDAVMIYDASNQQVTLTDYLSNLKKNLDIKDGTDGTDGKSFGTIKVQYQIFGPNTLSVNDVKSQAYWLDEVPKMTDEHPALWKRWKIVTILEDGSYYAPQDWTYEFCGYKGADGKDAAKTQNIYKSLARDDTKPSHPLSYINEDKLSDFLNSSDYQVDNFCPNGWSLQSPEIQSGYVIYVSSREKDADTGLWGNYSEPALWGVSGEDAETVYIYIAYLSASEPPVTPSSRAFIYPVSQSGAVLNGDYVGWSFNNPGDQVESGVYVYQSVGIFGPTGEVKSWSDPVRVTGPRGKDGDIVERVYQATKDNEAPSLDFLYQFAEASSDGNYGNSWFSLASYWQLDGVTYSYLWMAERSKNSDGTWKNDELDSRHGWPQWPTLVTIYGHAGVDGDGIQFVYLRLTEAQYKILQEGNHWNFSGVSCTDDDGKNPSYLKQLEDVYTVDWDKKQVEVTPKLQDDSSGTAVDLDGITFTYDLSSFNYYTSLITTYITKPQVHYKIDDDSIGTYYNYEFKVFQQVCDNYKVLVVNEICMVKLSSLADIEAGGYTMWGPTQHSKNGILSEIVIFEEYSLEVLKVTEIDGDTYKGIDITSEWEVTYLNDEAKTQVDDEGNPRESKFKKYTPSENLTIDSNTTYKIQLRVPNT